MKITKKAGGNIIEATISNPAQGLPVLLVNGRPVAPGGWTGEIAEANPEEWLWSARGRYLPPWRADLGILLCDYGRFAGRGGAKRLARALGIHQQQVSHWKTGFRQPDYEHRLQLKKLRMGEGDTQ